MYMYIYQFDPCIVISTEEKIQNNFKLAKMDTYIEMPNGTVTHAILFIIILGT